MTKIKVPPHVTIGAHTYSISLDSSLRDENNRGAANHRTLAIDIAPERPPSQKLEILMHEILHAINVIWLERELEEGEIGHLSEGLAQALMSFDIQLDWSGIPFKR